MSETYSENRYIIRCLGCLKLSEASRKDVLTCSTACRVRAHRKGTIKKLQVAAKDYGFPVTIIPRIEAIEMLRPDLISKVMSGELTEEDVCPEMIKSFWERVFEEAEKLREEE